MARTGFQICFHRWSRQGRRLGIMGGLLAVGLVGGLERFVAGAESGLTRLPSPTALLGPAPGAGVDWAQLRSKYDGESLDALTERAGEAAVGLYLGHIHERGERVSKSPEKAMGFYQGAAAAGNVPAQVRLEVLRVNGPLAERNTAGAMDRLEALARSGSAEAALKLGQLYFDQWHLDPANPDRAWDWIETAAQAGNADAQLMMVRLIGKYSEDPRLKAEVSRRSPPHPFARNGKGEPVGIPPPYGIMRLDWLRRSADQGHPEALRQLAMRYMGWFLDFREMEHHGVDPELGRRMLQEGSGRGDDACRAMLAMADMMGEGAPRDVEGGKARLEAIVDRAPFFGVYLGRYYAQDWSRVTFQEPPDYQLALKYYLLAGEAGAAYAVEQAKALVESHRARLEEGQVLAYARIRTADSDAAAIQVLESENGRRDPVPILLERLRQHPDWTEGLKRLAKEYAQGTTTTRDPLKAVVLQWAGQGHRVDAEQEHRDLGGPADEKSRTWLRALDQVAGKQDPQGLQNLVRAYVDGELPGGVAEAFAWLEAGRQAGVAESGAADEWQGRLSPADREYADWWSKVLLRGMKGGRP